MRQLRGALLLFFFCFCPNAAAESVKVVTSLYPLYIAALNVTRGVPHVEVSNMARSNAGCLHDYHLTPEDMKTIAGADVIIINGAGLEDFLAPALASLPAIRVIDAGGRIEKILTADGPNPHLWLSLPLHMQQVQTIADGLAQADSAHDALYRSNADDYKRKLAALDQRYRPQLAQASTRKIVTFHEAFAYLARDYELVVTAVIERHPGVEPSPRDLVEVIEAVRRTGTKAIFVEPQYPPRAAKIVARETDARFWTLDSIVSGPPDPDAYLRLMERNLAELCWALR